MAQQNTPGGGSYYEGINSGGVRIINYFNAYDAALNGWEFNQLTKPDYLLGENDEYDYDTELVDTQGSVYEAHWIKRGIYTLNGEELNEWFDDGVITTHKAMMLAHIIPARTHALGQRHDVNGVVFDNISLGYGSSNQDHSAQFHSTFPLRQNYWRLILSDSIGYLQNEYTGLQ